MVLVIIHTGLSQHVQISPFSDWYVSQSVQDILVGEDIQGTHTSREDHLLLSVNFGSHSHHKKMHTKWRVTVHREDRDWHKNLKVYVRRTGDGYGERYDKPIKNGSTFRKVNKGYRTLFKCEGSRFEIPIQFEVQGLSLTIPAKTYSTMIVFTIIDD